MVFLLQSDLRQIHPRAVRESRFRLFPECEVSYDFTKKITGGCEYYGSVGPATDFAPIAQQQQQSFPAIDLNLSPKWEVNFGVGVTRSTDHLIAKMILGYRFDFESVRLIALHLVTVVSRLSVLACICILNRLLLRC